MHGSPQPARYNHRNRQMESRATVLRLHCFLAFWQTSLHLTLLRIAWFLIAGLFLSSLSLASPLSDTARQLADRIASVTGPGAIALEVTNRSSLDDKSTQEVRSALQAQLRVQGIRTATADQSMGSVNVILSESLREYVWTAQIAIGSDPSRIVLVSLPRPPSAVSAGTALPITLKKTALFTQEQPILDAALLDANTPGIPGSSHLVVLEANRVAIYRQQSGHWELETSLPIPHSRTFPRDTRGRLFLRRDHLLDAYLPGIFCRSSASSPLSLTCSPSDDPWPLSSEENGAYNAPAVRAFYAPARNFFTGALSPGIGRISNVPSFYSAASVTRSNYTLWVLAAVDGSIHLVDGITDLAVRGGRAGSDLAAVRSNCGLGTQLLVSEIGDPAHDNDHDTLRAYEIPDREPVAVSVPLEFDGLITALWPDASQSSAIAIVKRADTSWYEANRISVSCGN